MRDCLSPSMVAVDWLIVSLRNLAGQPHLDAPVVRTIVLGQIRLAESTLS